MTYPRPVRPAVFLDRDDTLIENAALEWRAGEVKGDLCDPERVRLLPGALEGCRILRACGFTLVMVTNQGGVARGGCTLEAVEAANDRVCALLSDERPEAGGASVIEAVYFCPFHPTGSVERFAREHDWRKPGAGMFLAAAEELGLDLARSWMIGDMARDLEAAQRAGIGAQRCILIGRDAPDVLGAALVVLGRRAAGVGESVSIARLAAPYGAPLKDERIRDTVLATARAIAERTGVSVLELTTDDSSITAKLETPRVAALGFIAELRRLTNTWHERKFGSPLWPEEA